jgi:hypothetical protein
MATDRIAAVRPRSPAALNTGAGRATVQLAAYLRGVDCEGRIVVQTRQLAMVPAQ